MLTVITPAATARLATIEDTRTDLELPVSTPTNARLARMLDQASARISSACRRTFGRQIYRQRLLATCGTMVLAAGPVSRIISVGYRGADPLAADQYVLDGDTLILGRGRSVGALGPADSCFAGGSVAFEVEYEAGWVLPGEAVGEDFVGDVPLPPEIEAAAIQLVGVAISEAGRDSTVRSENVIGVGSTTYSTQAAGSALPHPGAEAAIQPYRNLVLA